MPDRAAGLESSVLNKVQVLVELFFLLETLPLTIVVGLFVGFGYVGFGVLLVFHLAFCRRRLILRFVVRDVLE